MTAMKTIFTLLTLVITITICQGQSCQQKLGDATRAYYNGQLREVETLLEGCLEELDNERLALPLVRRKTPTAGNEMTVVQQFLGNLGKFNRE